jgi:hypothetical protein
MKVKRAGKLRFIEGFVLVGQGNHQLDSVVRQPSPAFHLVGACKTRNVPVECDGLFDVADPQHGGRGVDFIQLFSGEKCSSNPFL